MPPLENPLNLAGIFISDGRIFAVVGKNCSRSKPSRDYTEFTLRIKTDLPQCLVRRFWIDNYISAVEALESVCQWIVDTAPEVDTVGVGCYGPFENIRDPHTENYGQLTETSHGEFSVDHNIVSLVNKYFSSYRAHRTVRVRIDTDAATLARGYIYLQSRNKENFLRYVGRTIAMIVVDRGIGGTFMKVRETEDWKGDLHAEIGQINVQPWTKEKFFSNPHARNTFSVEALASISALEYFYKTSFTELMSNPNHNVWEREAWYIAQLAWTVTCTASPSKIVLCGDVISVPGIRDKIVHAFRRIKGPESLPSYPEIENVEEYLITSLYNGDAKNTEYDTGTVGAIGALCIAASTDQIKSVSPTDIQSMKQLSS